MKLRSNILPLIIIMWATCLSAQFKAGSGTENDPYLISSQTELHNIRHFSDAYFLQTGDIYLENDWHPIELFNGFYDGNGYTIYNLNIKTNQDNTGLFSVLSEGQISSLRIEGGTVTGRDNVGALVGSNEGGIIYRCSANITVSGRNDVGGLIGSNFGVIEESFSHSSSITGSKNTGGLVGANYGEQIINCYSTNSVSGITSTGGLTGLNIIDGQVSNSYSTGKVLGETDTGGLAGKNLYAIIQNSYWDIESSGLTESAGGEGLTTVRMMQKDSYAWSDWAWAHIYWINSWSYPDSWLEDTDHPSYPYLRWHSHNIAHNEPVNKEEIPKFIHYDGSNEQWHWVSFPWLSRDQVLEENPRDEQTAEEVLRPWAWIRQPPWPQPQEEYVIIDSVLHYDGQTPVDSLYHFMGWNHNVNTPWNPNEIGSFCSTKGYKIRIADSTLADSYFLPAYGSRQDPGTDVILQPGVWQGLNFIYNANWVGYFIPFSVDFRVGLSSILDYVYRIEGQYGSMQRFGDVFWGSGVTLEYGQMYKVFLTSDVENEINFQWSQGMGGGRSASGRQAPSRLKPQHFKISNGPEYESIYIADIADDKDIVEIGVYIGGECVGATVFTDSYPLEILAYTNNSHTNEAMTFVLYLNDDSCERYDAVLLKDVDTGQYSRETITAQQNKFSIVNLDRTGGERSLAVEEEVEDIPPAFGLGQNYPNPFSIRTGVRGYGHTSISLSLPQDMPVNLNIYNIKGQLVRTLISGEVNRGEHTARWNGKDNNNNTVSSGIYFYRLETPDKTITRKMLIVR